MVGTIVNTCTIIVGTVIGTFLHRGVKDSYKEMLYTGLGLASLAIGLNATISYFGQNEYPVLFISFKDRSMSVGALHNVRITLEVIRPPAPQLKQW